MPKNPESGNIWEHCDSILVGELVRNATTVAGFCWGFDRLTRELGDGGARRKRSKASVRSILCDGSDIPPFPDEVEHMAVAHMAINAKQWKSGYGADGLGDSGGEHGQPVNTDGHGGGGGLGVTVDLPNLVHGLANELEARAGPLLALLKTHITQEMRSLKDEIFARGGISAPCGMADPARGDAGILNSGSPITVPRVQTRNPVVSSDTSTGCGGAEQKSTEVANWQFSGGNGRGATPHLGGPITNEVAPLDYVDHCPAMGEAREDGGEETSTSDGGHGKNDYGSAKNLKIIPPPNEDTSKEDCSAPPSPAEESEPTSMNVQLQPHSSPIKDATLLNDRSQSRRLLTPTLPNVPLGGAAVLISIEKGETKGNPNPSGVVQKRTSKRLHILFVPFSPPQPPPKKIKGKGGRKKTWKRTKKVQPEMATVSEVCASTTTSPTKLTQSFDTPTTVGPLVGGFSPCVRLNAFRVAGFCTLMHTERDYNLGEGVIVPNSVFKFFFEVAVPQPIKVVDMLVTFIRSRLRKEDIQSSQFLPGSLVKALRGEYQQFIRVQDIAKFSFSIDGRHWIGVVIDIAQWRIYVLDCNCACVQDEKLETLLQPIVVLMPFLIRLNGGDALNEAATESPLQLTRLDLPICCEQKDNMAQVSNLTEERLSIAAKTYAVEAFACFNPEYLKEFDAGDNVATVDATKKVEVELIKAGEREKILRHCLTISWAGFIIAIAIIASRCLK
ncbi:hypothetical protein IGI04_002349 [Brassica rapa subsp. trilocularis]|uniref:Ubiquitin-like protease family profile domain-containing protein n=1 Tax=Brassica rapa subsp. trilocularis TaxID=1813537 RepID=A0ABQ7NVA4_BRACM|nr:hypothetical protein IGI04_002349 [Brassica rapa subsp. trilocularis]